MDWQQIAALSIVAATAALFIRARLRRRKAKLPCGAYCGFSGGAPSGQTVVYHARKGRRPEIIVKMKQVTCANEGRGIVSVAENGH